MEPDVQKLIFALKVANESLESSEGVDLLYYMELCGDHKDFPDEYKLIAEVLK